MSAWQTARALGRRASWLTWYTSRSPHHVRSTWWQARSLSVYHLRRVDTVKFHTKRLPLNSRSSTPHMNTEAMPPPSLRAWGCPAPAAAAQQARLERPQRLGSRSRLLLAAGGQAFPQTRLSPCVLASVPRHALGLGARQPTAAAGTQKPSVHPARSLAAPSKLR